MPNAPGLAINADADGATPCSLDVAEGVRQSIHRKLKHRPQPTAAVQLWRADRFPYLRLMMPFLCILASDVHPVCGALLARPRDWNVRRAVRRERGEEFCHVRAAPFEQVNKHARAEALRRLHPRRVQLVNESDKVFIIVCALGRRAGPVSVSL